MEQEKAKTEYSTLWRERRMAIQQGIVQDAATTPGCVAMLLRMTTSKSDGSLILVEGNVSRMKPTRRYSVAGVLS